MIFQPVVNSPNPQPYLVYAQRFDCPHGGASPKQDNGLFELVRGKSASGRRKGAVVEAGHIRCAVDVAPFFGKEADRRLTYENSLEAATNFNLNTYSDKQIFHLLKK
jgi:hypothetical protein